MRQAYFQTYLKAESFPSSQEENAFHKNSSWTQVNRCPNFVQVPFRCKLSWNPLNKINSYKRRAVSITLLTISWIIKSGLFQPGCRSYWVEIRPLDSSNQELFCFQQSRTCCHADDERSASSKSVHILLCTELLYKWSQLLRWTILSHKVLSLCA